MNKDYLDKELIRRRNKTIELIKEFGLYEAMMDFDFIPEDYTDEEAIARIIFDETLKVYCL